MKTQFELTLVTKRESKVTNAYGEMLWDTKSIDVVMGANLVELLAQFQIVLARIHRQIVQEVKDEYRIPIDDDIPF